MKFTLQPGLAIISFYTSNTWLHVILSLSSFITPFQNVNYPKSWPVPINSTIGNLRQEDCWFEANLGYPASSCLNEIANTETAIPGPVPWLSGERFAV